MNALSTSESLSSYFTDIQQYKMLTVEDEQKLARKFRKGDLKAGHALVTANLRFVVKIANEYRSYGLRMADLIQEGNIGLLKGVQKFDPDQGVRLISYAVWWIRAYVQNYVLSNWSLVKIGTTQAQRKLFFSLAKTRRELERQSTDSSLIPDVNEIAKRLNVKPAEVMEMQQRMAGHDGSLDAPLGDEEDGESAMSLLASSAPDQHDNFQASESAGKLSVAIQAALSKLDARERFIVENRLMADEGMTLVQLATKFGFSRERARQLEIRAVKKLKEELAAVDAELNGTAEQLSL